jgi:phosphatidylinositol alpha-mannosyltransferase
VSASGRALRVCLVSAAYRPYPSGVSEHVHHLALELQRLGHTVHVLTTRFSHKDEADPGIPVTRLGRALLIPVNRSYATLPFGFGMPFQVPRFVGRNRFDLIHCHGVFPPEIAYWALVGTRAPAVVTFHTLGELPSEPLLRIFRTLFAGLNRRISARIGVSQAGAEFAHRLFPGDYHVIPNGVDLDRFRPDAAVPALMRGNRPTVLYVGRFDKRKGLPVLLQAMPRVIAAVPSVRLIAVGGGLLEDECRRLARDSCIGDRILFPGRATADELPGYYAGCTVFCSPATGGEALGIVLLEAMAAGRPVVASDIEGYNEVVTTELDGLLVPPENPVALSTALTRVLLSSELRAALSSRAQARAREFAWPGIARRVEQVYRKVL